MLSTDRAESAEIERRSGGYIVASTSVKKDSSTTRFSPQRSNRSSLERGQNVYARLGLALCHWCTLLLFVGVGARCQRKRCPLRNHTVLSCSLLSPKDVANSYATSVSSRSLTLVQAGCLAIITEFIGAIALGQRVTGTIRSGVFSVTPFLDRPGVLILANVCAEAGAAIWLTACTRLGFPVSTTQSLVGALVGVGIACDIHVNWGWKSGSVSQIAASWGVFPGHAVGNRAHIQQASPQQSHVASA